MDTLNLTLTRTTSRPATDHPINHTPRPSRAPMTKDPFLLQTIPNPPSPTKSRIADIFHRRRQISRQQQQPYPHPPTSMLAPLADDNNIEMHVLPHDRAKKTDSTSTSMGTPKSPAYPPGAVAPLPVAAAAAPSPATNNKNVGRQHRSAPAPPRTTKAGGLLLEGVRYSLPGGEPVGWFEMFEKTRKFEGGFVETPSGQVRCIHPSAWGEDELGEYGPGGGEGQVVRSPGGMGGRGKGGGGRVSNVVGGGGRGIGDGDGVGDAAGEGASTGPSAAPQQGGMMERGDSETLGNARFGESVVPTETLGNARFGESVVPPETLSNARFGESIVPTTSRSAALRSGLIGLDDDGEDGDDEAEGGPSSGRSHEMEIKVALDQGPELGMMIGGGRVV